MAASGRQREGAESADPQDLHDVVKAALLEVQFQSVQPDPSPEHLEEMLICARD